MRAIDYTRGHDAGTSDRAKCYTAADVNWYGLLAVDAQRDGTITAAYANGYLDAINGGAR